METDMILVWTSLPQEALALAIAETLVTEELAACVHVLPGGHSVYRWQGVINREAEWTVWIKSRRDLYPLLEERLLALHPYECPEILRTAVERALPAYGAWVNAVTRQPPPR